MKKALLFFTAITSFAVFVACNRVKDIEPTGNGEVYLDLPQNTYKYFDNLPTSDSADEQATLGRVLFYDRHLSINNSISCGSCHRQSFAFSDNVAKSAGFENRLTGRNTPALQNLGFSGFGGGIPGGRMGGSLFWDGRENDMQKLITRPIANHVEMGMSDLNELTQKLAALPFYRELFTKAFGSPDITIERVSRAVALFVNAIRATNTRFDQYQQKLASLTALELEGSDLFTRKYNCERCHNEQIGGYFSGRFMDIGLDDNYADLGLGAITGSNQDRGKFKVPNLRNVALTAPYMHDGRFKTLNDVLEHYSHGIKSSSNLDTVLKTSTGPMRMNISTHEKEALIAFLGTLTDGEMITNPAYSDPFKTR